MQFDRNEYFSSFEFSSAGIKIGELGSAHEKFGVWTGPHGFQKIAWFVLVTSIVSKPL